MISRTTLSFWKAYDSLPSDVRRRADRVYTLWREAPGHPSLRLKCVSDRHAVYSVRIGLHWRALGYRERQGDDDVLTWFRIGSHADYDRLISSET